jgi:hypothetical protein
VALELAHAGRGIGRLQVMVPHANPVVQSLQREVEILAGLELNDSQPIVRSDAEQIEQAAVAGARDGRHLGIDVVRIEPRDDARSRRLRAFRRAASLGLGAVANAVRVGIVGGRRTPVRG